MNILQLNTWFGFPKDTPQFKFHPADLLPFSLA